jgi:hypothetical protein
LSLFRKDLNEFEYRQSILEQTWSTSNNQLDQHLILMDVFEASHEIMLSLSKILHHDPPRLLEIIWNLFDYLKIQTQKHRNGDFIFEYFERVLSSASQTNKLDDLDSNYMIITAFQILFQFGPLCKVCYCNLGPQKIVLSSFDSFG